MKKSVFVGIALLIAAAAAYGVWRLSVSVQEPRPESSGEAQSIVSIDTPSPGVIPSPEAIPTPVASASPGAPSSPALMPTPAPTIKPVSAPVPISPTAVDQIARCLPAAKNATSGARTLNEALSGISKSLGGVTERSDTRRLVHIELPNGEKRRIRLIPADKGDVGAPPKGARSGTKLQIFTEDAEGLPVPMPVPRDDAQNPTAETLKKYTSMGKETYRESASQLRFKNGAIADIQEENGYVRLLQVSASGASLGCALDEISREADCQCLSQP